MPTAKQARKPRPKGTGQVRRLPSGRYQATITVDGRRFSGPTTYETKAAANAWLLTQTRDVTAARWQPPAAKTTMPTVGEYAETWLAERPLKPRTVYQYRLLLDDLILPDLGSLPVDRLSPLLVRQWHADLTTAGLNWRAQGYSLLRAICTTAVSDELLPSNPCKVRGAGRAKTKHKSKPATLAELEVIVDKMPERYRLMVLLAAWCAMRFGELTELRRKDITLTADAGRVRIERGVVKVGTERIIGDPKSDAGKRTVAVPPHLIPMLEAHLEKHVGPDLESLVFPARQGGHMAPASLYKVFYAAREAAGRPDLRFHDLRHTGATLAAATGATLGDLMQRLGHSTAAAALRYQHAVSDDRDAAIALALSGFAEAGKVGLKTT